MAAAAAAATAVAAAGVVGRIGSTAAAAEGRRRRASIRRPADSALCRMLVPKRGLSRLRAPLEFRTGWASPLQCTVQLVRQQCEVIGTTA